MEKKYTEQQLKSNFYHKYTDVIPKATIHDIVDGYLVFLGWYGSDVSFTYKPIECVPLELFSVGSYFIAIPVQVMVDNNVLLTGHSYFVNDNYVGSVLVTHTNTDSGKVKDVKWFGAV